MSTQMKQIIFVGLAVVLIAFTVILLRPQGGPAIPAGAASGQNVPASQGAAGGQSQPDPALMKRIGELQEKVQQDSQDVKSMYELAALYFEFQQYPLAADLYNRVLDIEPKNVDARVQLGKAYFFQGMSSTAIREFRKAVADDPKKADPHYQLALALSHSSPPDIDAAVTEWNEVIKLAPDTDIAKKAQSFIDAYQKQN